MTRPKNMNVVRMSNYNEQHDDFPTPPWATRAFFKYVSTVKFARGTHFLEPACGRGHMVSVLREKGFRCTGSDAYDYSKPGFGVADYCDLDLVFKPYDVMFTNPPFKKSNQFVLRGLSEARLGVAVLLRTIWMESVTRYTQIFYPTPPTVIAVFSRRMQAAHGKLVRKGGAMMSHSWFWWDLKSKVKQSELMWIPPEAQSELERDEDYG